MDEKELQAVSDALEELRRGGTISAETLGKLGGTAESANKALEGYTKKIIGAASAVGGMARQVADGEGTFKSLGGAISGLTGVVGKLAGAIPVIGGAARALAEGVGEAAKFVLDQLDTMAKNQQTLGDASAGAVDGITGLKRQFENLGNFSLPGFTKAVKANVQGIAALGGTAALGAEELAKVSGSLTTGGTAQKFLKLGMSLESVGEATAQYLSDTARLGLNQGDSTEELTKKTQNYIVEVDKIARLTGQTREAQAKEAQKTMVDVRFRAKLAEMAASGQGKEAEELKKYVEGLGGAAGDAARAMALGIPLTKEAAEANIFSNDAIRQNTESLKSGEKRATTAIADTNQALADGTKTFGSLLMVGKDLGGVGIQALEAAALLERRNALEKTGLSREDAIAQAQNEQMNSQDKATVGFTAAQLATAGASKDLQSLGFTLAKAAIPAVDAFATSLKKVTGFIDEKFGSGKSGGAGGPTTGPGLMRKFGMAIGAVGAGPGGASGATDASGLKLKDGAEKSGKSTDVLYGVADQVHKLLGGDYKYFSGLNDRTGGSKHASGQAFDLVLKDGANYDSALGKIKGVDGVSFAQFEPKGHRNANGSVSNGDHIHAEVSAAAGAILSGPMSGYKPNLTMHGTEAIVPLNNSSGPLGGAAGTNSLLPPLNRAVSLLTELVQTERSAAAYQRQIMHNSKM